MSGTQLCTQPGKIEVIQKIEQLNPKKQLRSCSGLASFNRKFVPNPASLTSSLLKKDVKKPIEFDEKELSFFDDIKRDLTSHPILHFPSMNKIFDVRTDAAAIDLPAILMQYFEDE